VVSTSDGAHQAQTTLTVTATSSLTTVTTAPGTLSFTGSNVGRWSLLALFLLVAGFAAVASSQRRRRPW
jgi:hypothetical protein